jgi:hypothetical protein
MGSYKSTRDEAHQRVRHESDLDSDPAMSGNVLAFAARRHPAP